MTRTGWTTVAVLAIALGCDAGGANQFGGEDGTGGVQGGAGGAIAGTGGQVAPGTGGAAQPGTGGVSQAGSGGATGSGGAAAGSGGQPGTGGAAAEYPLCGSIGWVPGVSTLCVRSQANGTNLVGFKDGKRCSVCASPVRPSNTPDCSWQFATSGGGENRLCLPSCDGCEYR